MRIAHLTPLRVAAGLGAAALATAVVMGCATPSVDGEATIARASQAMGGSNLKSIRYTADGTGYTFGQAFVPGAAWPKITVHSQVRSINYDTGSMREEITISRAEPTGGGGYPLQGQQRNDQFVSGVYAWNQTPAGPQPGPRFVGDRVHQLWITPHGVLKAAQRNKATAQTRSDGTTALTFSEPGRFGATAVIGADGLVQRVDSRVPDPVLGEVDVVTRYSNYRDVAGVKFPGRIEQTHGRRRRARRAGARGRAQRGGRHRGARRAAQLHRTGDHREDRRRRVVRRRRLAQQRGHRDERPHGAGGNAAERRPQRAGDRRGEGAGARQADPLRDQFAPALRPRRRPAHRGGRRRHHRHAGGQRAVPRARAGHAQPHRARSPGRNRASARASWRWAIARS